MRIVMLLKKKVCTEVGARPWDLMQNETDYMVLVINLTTVVTTR